MLHRYETVLELDKTLQKLSKFATSQEAVERAISLRPYEDRDIIESELEKTDGATILSVRYGRPSFYSLKNPVADLTRAKAGAPLSIPSLLNLKEIFSQARSLKSWRKRCEDEVTSLDGEFSRLVENHSFEDKISKAILSEDQLSDNASDELFRIRRAIVRQSGRVKESLEKLLRSDVKKYLQENIVTIRDNRYVIPVKAEYRSQVPGLLHDASASGATVFIEPVSVVEANNEIRILTAKEQEEIDRILLELSSLAADCSKELINNYETIISLDVYFAKASYAIELKATKPNLSDIPLVDFKEARHPLLDAETVVPISVKLGEDYNGLIITGPNTGGKTVALKTIGLLVLMAKCGLLLPVAEGSTFYPFNSVLADIGDEQSIEQSLSTFSAHISRIIKILSVADSDSLVLLDELGSGTDPLEGAALAEAILEEIKNRGGLFMATTHYPELKTYALQTSGVENACFEFDVKTFCPTYRLLIGVPGSSNAFAISKRLGLPDGIIDSAKANLSGESRRFEEALDAMEEARKKYEKEYAEIAESGAAVKELRVRLEKREAKLLEEEDKKLEEASKRAKYIIDEARVQANRVIDELEELRKQKENEDLKELLGKAKSIRSKNIDQMYAAADPVIERNDEDYSLPRELVVGDKVLIYSMNKKAEVVERAGKNKKVLVRLGSMNTRVIIDDLRLIEAKESKKPTFSPTRSVKKNAQRQVSAELDIRGKNAEEAILEIDMFIDHAVLANLNQVTIIHGKGTGVLRKAVQTRLKSHPNVKTYRLGVFGEGEAGVTIACLK